ncbi:hypothetical protein HRbin05_00213 [archaeon HR05]|jgi:hypothetical protein|nr:hypothetical protein HRbin05_00213 [archaeon HR05]
MLAYKLIVRGRADRKLTSRIIRYYLDNLLLTEVRI